MGAQPPPEQLSVQDDQQLQSSPDQSPSSTTPMSLFDRYVAKQQERRSMPPRPAEIPLVVDLGGDPPLPPPGRSYFDRLVRKQQGLEVEGEEAAGADASPSKEGSRSDLIPAVSMPSPPQRPRYRKLEVDIPLHCRALHPVFLEYLSALFVHRNTGTFKVFEELLVEWLAQHPEEVDRATRDALREHTVVHGPFERLQDRTNWEAKQLQDALRRQCTAHYHSRGWVMLGDLSAAEVLLFFVRPAVKATVSHGGCSLVQGLAGGDVALALQSPKATFSAYDTEVLQVQWDAPAQRLTWGCSWMAPAAYRTSLSSSGGGALGAGANTATGTASATGGPSAPSSTSGASGGASSRRPRGLPCHISGPATFAVSHVHSGGPFREVVGMLLRHYHECVARRMGRELYYLLDIFAVGVQGGLDEAEVQPEVVAYPEAIAQAQRLLCPLFPLPSPPTARRLWCLFEMAVAARGGLPVELLLPEMAAGAPPGTTRLGYDSKPCAVHVVSSYAELHSQLTKALLEGLDVAAADCTRPGDRAHLSSVIQQQWGGADAVNELLRGVLQPAVEAVAQQAAQALRL